MRIVIEGVVQGVGFRPTVQRVASSLGLKGRVWNDGSKVLIDIDDPDRFIPELKKNLPPLAVIDSIAIEEAEMPDCDNFSIIQSKNSSNGVSIPADTAICDECLNELRGNGRRKGYEFTTCTNCGPRFTLMNSMPYDRKNTSMNDFELCDDCKKEYSSQNDRRLHHQTICCPKCGPKYYLLDSNRKEIKGNPIQLFADAIDKCKIGVVKSWGGMHICTPIENIDQMRKWYGREQKPFAIMVKDLKTAKKFVKLNKKEEELLTSPNRPIVLCDKISDSVCRNIAPGLDNIGIFLPYTGMQHLLFDTMKHDALIMTSANLPGEPMILDDLEIMDLGADLYLLHNQRIVNRADDTVVRVFDSNTQFIRKSRGFIPSFIPFSSKHFAVGLGGQENLTATVGAYGRLYSTQHIGNGESLGVVEYLESATDSLIRHLDCKPDVVAVDLHPGYVNRKFGKKLSEEYHSNFIEVQHHWAHAASLMAEHNVDAATVITIDGTGHGDDGQAWGGEILECDFSNFKRTAHLEYIPLIGSEKALYDLRRLKFAIDSINGIHSDFIDEKDADVMTKMLKKSVSSSSLGRLLDALSFTLGVCEYRSYDGEPAMKTEALLNRGKFIDGFETETISGVIQTAHLFKEIPKGAKKEDIAYSIVKNVIDEMANVACDNSKSGIIGLSGGCSYSRPITTMVKDAVEKRGFKLLIHDKIPNGDGGISVGQVAIALRTLD